MAAASLSVSLSSYPATTTPTQNSLSKKTTALLHFTLGQSSIINNNIGFKVGELAVNELSFSLSLSSSNSRRFHVLSATTDKSNALPLTETVSPASTASNKSVFTIFFPISHCCIVFAKFSKHFCSSIWVFFYIYFSNFNIWGVVCLFH